MVHSLCFDLVIKVILFLQGSHGGICCHGGKAFGESGGVLASRAGASTLCPHFWCLPFLWENLTGWNQTHAAAAERGCGLIHTYPLWDFGSLTFRPHNGSDHFWDPSALIPFHDFDGFLKLWPCVFKHVDRLLMRWSKCRTKVLKRSQEHASLRLRDMQRYNQVHNTAQW